MPDEIDNVKMPPLSHNLLVVIHLLLLVLIVPATYYNGKPSLKSITLLP